MSWNFENSSKRLKEEWRRLEQAGITVTPLTREMDLSGLSLTDARLVTGVHLYADIRNLDDLLMDPKQRRDDYRRVYRTLQLTRVEIRRIIQSVFGGDKIQVQGPKFHGLLFRPYNDPEAMADDAILAGLAIYAALTEAFSSVFDHYPALVPTIGIDFGDCLVANIGVRGDRELISIGNAANNAAKIMRGGDHAITVGKNLYDHLDDEKQGWFFKCGKSYRLNCADVEDIDSLVKEEGFKWSTASSANKFQEGKDALPLADIAVEDAREQIALERLSPTCAKRVPAASVFVDIDGYTKLVSDLDGDTEELARAVQVLHLFRYELRHVTENDMGGIALQHQGDRLQALLHDPSLADEDVMEHAVDLCIAYNSSVEEVINKNHDILGQLHVAIGCAFGKTLVGKLGVKGDRDPVCIGDATQHAEQLQLAMAGNHLAITEELHDAITDEEVADLFTHNKEQSFYEATNLTELSIEETADTNAYATAKTASYTSAGTISIGSSSATPLKVTRPYAE
jgi:class 3 adenylate cyclase